MDFPHFLLLVVCIVLGIFVLPAAAKASTTLRDSLVSFIHTLMDEADVLFASLKRPAKPLVPVSPTSDPSGPDAEMDANYVAFKLAHKRGDDQAAMRALMVLRSFLPAAPKPTGGTT